MPANKLLYAFLLVLGLWQGSACGPRHEQREQSPGTPREGSSAEYPGSKEIDSLWKNHHAQATHKEKE